MPDFDIGYLLGEAAHVYVYSVMLAPEDAELQQAILHAVWAEAVADQFFSPAKDGQAADVGLVRFLYSAPKVDLLLGKGRLRSIWVSSGFCAWALGFILRAEAHDRPDLATLAAVLRGGHRKTGRSIDALKSDWRKYRSVSHLWLVADHFIGHLGGYSGLNDELLPRFLCSAELLRGRGERWKPKRRGGPVLDPATTWKVPAGYDMPGPFCLALHPPTAEELDLVRP